MGFSLSARRLGISAAAGIVLLGLAYAVTLIAGLLSLQSPQQPIGGWCFSILGLLILLLAPLAVVLMVAVHAWAPPEAKTYSLTALVFMGLRRVRSRHCCLGRLLWAGHAVCRTCLQRWPARDIDSDSDDHQWGASSCRVEWSRCRGHAAWHDWGDRLCGHVPRCGTAVGDLVYAN